MTSTTPKRRFDFYPLEERVLLSGDALEGSGTVLEADAEAYWQYLAEATADAEAQATTQTIDALPADAADPEPRRTEVVIVAPSVHDHETLLANLRSSAADGSQIQWIVYQLAPDQDGIQQISSWLAELAGIDAVHLISGGDGEGLQLGNVRLDLETAAAYAGQIAGWSHSLGTDADLLIYGSNLAATDDGRALLETLAILCDCDIAASENVTGHGSLGGDWHLEYALGSIQSDVFLSLEGQEQWHHVVQASSSSVGDEVSNAGQTTRQELVFIDMSVSNYQQLVEDLLSGDASSQYIVWLLASDRDGVLQISEALAGFSELDAVHIVSHGTSTGAMQLGNTWLSLSNLDHYSVEIALWGDSLNVGADLLLYGCDLASSASGQAMLQRLAELSGADVAASTDGTGHVALGANWNFEYSVGMIETQQAFSDALQEAWLSVLALQTVRDEFSAASYSNNHGTQSWSSSWVESDSQGGGASGGNIYIASGRLYVTAANTGNFVRRDADLTSATDATLSFSYYNNLSGSATISVLISNDLVNFTTLQSFHSSNTGTGTISIDISSYISATTRLVLYVSDTHWSVGSTSFYVDNVQIAYNVNTAPVLAPASPAYNTTEDSGPFATTVATMVGSTISDPDSGAQQGIAITGVAGSGGTLRYSIDGGATWQTISSVSNTNALLLRSSDLIQFVPDPHNGGTMTADYRAWDRTIGTAGGYANTSVNGGSTAFSTGVNTVTINSASINDAPVLDNSGTFSLASITEDDANNGGHSVASMIASAGGNPITDVDHGSVQGIAITALSSGNGTWEYSLNGGTTWTAVGAVSGTASLLLRDTDLIRFQPNSENGTVAGFTFRAWDQTSGSAGNKVDTSANGGMTAFSTAQANTSITVTDVNDAPVLSGANDFAAIDEDPVTNSGTPISALIAGHVADVDSGALSGIAVTAVDDAHGTWQYSLNGGTSWADFGTVSDSAARLLADTAGTLIRFVPNQDWNGTTSIQFRAWDQTQGTGGDSFNITSTGGTTAFSSVTGTSSLMVNPVNDAPVISVEPGNSDGETLVETDAGLTTQGTLTVTDVDAPDTVQGSVTGLVISGVTSGLQSDHADVLAMLTVTETVIGNGDTTGTLTWTFDSGSEAFDHLAVGETLVLTYTITVTDSQSATDTQEITITITGTNDAPLISLELGDSDGAGLGVTGAALTADGTLSVVDADRSDEVTAAITGFTKFGDTTGLTLDDSQLEALLSVNANVISDTQQSGQIQWAFDSAGYTFTYLGSGETLTLVYTITVTDSQGAVDTQDVTIVITGDNSAPVISVQPGDSDSETLIETDTALATGGTLTVTDINTTDEVTAQVSSVLASGTTAGLVPDNAALLAMLGVTQNVIDGTSTSGQINWTFDSGSEAFDYLAAGETLVLTYTVTVTDSPSATDSQEITITITGTNDAPVIYVQGGDSDAQTLGANGATLTADGTLSVEDVDRSDTVTATISGMTKSGDIVGLGLSDAQLQSMLSVSSAVIDASGTQGSLTWQFDSGTEHFAYLADGESLTLVYEITVTDTQGASSSHNVTMVITGANTPPEIQIGPGDSASEALIETDAGLSVSGTLSVRDANTTDLVTADVTSVVSFGTTFGLEADNAALLAMLGVTQNVIDGTSTSGQINWSFDSGSEAFDYLAAGETLVLTYTVTVTDTAGATDSHEITITITGTNDAPVIQLEPGDSEGEILAASSTALTTSGTMTVVDLDLSDEVSAAVSGFSKSGNLVGLSLSDAQLEAMLNVHSAIIAGNVQEGSINWTFDSDSETFAYLAQGESLTLVWEVTVTDTQGSSSSRDVTIVITGTNTPPQISIEPGDSANETLLETDSSLNASGTLSVFDANTTDIVTAAVTSVVSSGTTAGLASGNPALMAMLTVSTTVIDDSSDFGTLIWTFDSGSEAFDYLAAGETLTLTYTVTTTDSAGGSDSQEITITVTGTNDAPRTFLDVGDSDGEILSADGTSLATNGAISVEDLDRSDVVAAAVTGFSKFGNSTGLSLSDGQLQAMLSVNSAVIDAVNQQGALVWHFDSDGEMFAYLAQGESLTLIYTLTVTDTHGASDSRDVTIVIHGTNTPPEISVEPGDSAHEVIVETNAGLNTSGTLTVHDANLSDVVTATVDAVTSSGTTSGLQSDHTALLAMLSVNTTVIDALQTSGTLNWTFNSGSEAFDYLAVGESLTLVYTVVVTDSQGATGTHDLTITVNGTNDAPVVSVQAGDVDQVSIIEDTQTIVSAGSLSVYDADRSDQVTAAVTGLLVSGHTAGMTSDHAALLSMLSVSPVAIDGTAQAGKIDWTFNSGAEVFSHLWTGRSLVLQYSITVTDSQGATANHQVTITIHGDNAFPVAAADAYTVRAGETLAVSAPGPLANDYDPDGDPLALVLVSGPSYGTLTIAANGNFIYVPNGGFVGTDTFRYRANDGRLNSQIVEVTISVTAPSSSGGSGDGPPTPPPNTGGAAVSDPGSDAGFDSEDASLSPGDASEALAEREERAAPQTQGDVELSSGRLLRSADQAYTPAAYRSAESEQITVGLLPRLSAVDNLQQRYVALQELRDDLANAVLWGPSAEENTAAGGLAFGLGSVIIGSPGAAAGIVTAGYVLWAVRGAALLATLATSMPAWRNLDPSTLLADYRASQGDGGEDELESMIGK